MINDKNKAWLLATLIGVIFGFYLLVWFLVTVGGAG